MQGKTIFTGILAGVLIVAGISLLMSAQTFLAGIFITSLGLIALAFTLAFAMAKPEEDSAESTKQKKPFFNRNKKYIESLNLEEDDLKILELMRDGNSNQEIAHKLNIPINKVNVIVNDLFKKLDVSRRSKAIEKAQKLKLIH